MMVFESVTLALAQTHPMILFAQETAPPAGNGFGGIFGSPLLPLLVIGVMFYFMLILPERKKRKALEEQLNQLKKNDNVIISGGICGVVVGATAGSKYVTVRVDDTNNTRLRVLRTHILQVGSHDEPETKDVAAKETDKKG